MHAFEDMRSKRLLTKIEGVETKNMGSWDFALGQKGYFSSSLTSIPFIVLKSVCFTFLEIRSLDILVWPQQTLAQNASH